MRNQRGRSVVLGTVAVLLLGHTTIAQLRTRVVRVPSQYPSIQAAIDVTRDGDVVLVADGTYSGEGFAEIDYRGRAITVRSENGPENCRIEGDGIVKIFHFNNGEPSEAVVEGFTLARASNAIVIERSSPTIRNCIITDSESTAIQLDRSDSTITGCIVTLNGGGISLSLGAPAVIDCQISRNDAQGIGIREADARIIGCSITENTTAGEGGGITWRSRLERLTVSGCVISRNRAKVGGGLYLEDLGGFGGSEVVITDCTIEENVATENGGGIYLGHGIDDRTMQFKNCLVVGNRAEQGGGIYMGDSVLAVVSGCTIVDNRADDDGGGLYFSAANGRTLLIDSILWGNTDNQIGGVGEEPFFNVVFSDIQGGWPGEGNIDDDPLFVTGSSGDFYLSHMDAGEPETSPCVDAGADPAEHVGMDTYTTRTDEVPDTGMVDMGYHYTITEICGLVNRLKLKCKPRPGRFNLRATVVSELIRGTELTLTLDGENPKKVTVKKNGRAKAKWKVFKRGKHEVCIVECPNICRVTKCGG